MHHRNDVGHRPITGVDAYVADVVRLERLGHRNGSTGTPVDATREFGGVGVQTAHRQRGVRDEFVECAVRWMYDTGDDDAIGAGMSEGGHHRVEVPRLHPVAS